MVNEAEQEDDVEDEAIDDVDDGALVVVVVVVALTGVVAALPFLLEQLLGVSIVACLERLIFVGGSLSLSRSLSLSLSRSRFGVVATDRMIVSDVAVVDGFALGADDDDVVVVRMDVVVVAVEVELTDDNEDDMIVADADNDVLRGVVSVCLDPRVFPTTLLGSLSRSLSLRDL